MELTTEESVQAYLSQTLYPNCTVERLPEGSAGFVYRVQTHTEPSSVIVKHAQGYAARAKQWKLDQDRMNYEVRALRYLATITPQIQGIRVPSILHFDDDAWLLVLEDVGNCSSVKGWLQPGVDTSESKELGTKLGRFLANVHDDSAGRTELLEEFYGNSTAKHISGTLYFGRLPQAMAKFGFTGEHIEAAAKQGEDDVQQASEVLTLGDYWTGNVLVGEGRELFVVDLELSKPGTADFDVGQMAAELYCVAAFRSRDVGMAILNAFLNSYRQARQGQVDAAKVAIRIAAHLCVIGPVAWSSEASHEQIAEQVKLANMLLKLGVSRDVAGLRESIVAPLIA